MIIIPRNFKLLDELEKAEKGSTDMSISYGLVESDDISLTNWQCTFLGPIGSPIQDRIISLLVHCGEKYPSEPPVVKFQTKVNVPFVVRVEHLLFIYSGSPSRAAYTCCVPTAFLSPIPHSRRRTRPASVTLPKPTYPGTSIRTSKLFWWALKTPSRGRK